MPVPLKRLALIALFAVAAFPASAQDASSWDAVVAAAKKEGKVVVYNMSAGAPFWMAVVKSFEQKYGISVDSLDLRASELVERIRTEQSAGRFLGDTEIVSTTMIEEQLKNGDFIQKLPPIPNAANIRPPFKTTEYSLPAYVQPMGILINTRMVKDADVPASWNDLTDPKWKGKLLSDDMRPLGSGNTEFAILEKTMGHEYNEKLAEQKPVFSRDMRNDARRIARGRIPDLYHAGVRAGLRPQGPAGQGGDPQGGRALRADGHGDAEGSAASERRAPVHATFPQRRFAIGLRQWLDAASGTGRGRQGRSGRKTVRQRQVDRPGQIVRTPGHDGACAETLSLRP